jgi:hypothetical protein
MKGKKRSCFQMRKCLCLLILWIFLVFLSLSLGHSMIQSNEYWVDVYMVRWRIQAILVFSAPEEVFSKREQMEGTVEKSVRVKKNNSNTIKNLGVVNGSREKINFNYKFKINCMFTNLKSIVC